MFTIDSISTALPGEDPGFFFRRGYTRLLLYFNTNKPHSFFFLQNTSCIRKLQVIPLDSPLSPVIAHVIVKVFYLHKKSQFVVVLCG